MTKLAENGCACLYAADFMSAVFLYYVESISSPLLILKKPRVWYNNKK